MGFNRRSLQLWGGVECTINRVGNSFFDQLEFSGHARRIEDLEIIASIGIQCLRYPVLWERSETAPGRFDLSWSDRRLARLHELGIDPIVGLVHHGSGPAHTSLLDSRFPEKLSHYARAVAARYPSVRRFTPVNEPLTTARFSGLYGHWYPHGQSDRTFVRALLTQCRGICAAMAAIREVNPEAELVQTEDMGIVRSTEDLRYQADFENERRWLSLDLLAGRVTQGHPMFDYLVDSGASRPELDEFVEYPCPPDLVGLNYYVTSERFLDSRVELYPPTMIGGNGRHDYADVEAVRVCADGLIGPTCFLVDAYERYDRPVAITEAHLGCSPEQQIRWLAYVWNSAQTAHAFGVDVRAVTAWALFGAYGWDRLVTDGPGRYEPGVFDVSQGFPVETPLSDFVRALASGEFSPPTPGWWEVEDRLLYEPHVAPQPARKSKSRAA